MRNTRTSSGHTAHIISSRESRAFILGDIISCPLQIKFPKNEGTANMDRELILCGLEGDFALVGGPHFHKLELVSAKG